MSKARILIVTQPRSPVRHRLCARINALGLDKELGERIHWSLCTCGRPEPFNRLLTTLQTELKSHGFKDDGHRPHITIRYKALHALPTRRIDPVDWLIDEIQLVERTGTGKQLRYQLLHRWPLASGSPPRPQQLRLFH